MDADLMNARSLLPIVREYVQNEISSGLLAFVLVRPVQLQFLMLHVLVRGDLHEANSQRANLSQNQLIVFVLFERHLAVNDRWVRTTRWQHRHLLRL